MKLLSFGGSEAISSGIGHRYFTFILLQTCGWWTEANNFFGRQHSEMLIIYNGLQGDLKMLVWPRVSSLVVS